MNSPLAKNENRPPEHRLLKDAKNALTSMANHASSRGYFGVLRVELTIQDGKIEILRTVAEKTVR